MSDRPRSRCVYRGSFLEVTSESVDLPNGNRIDLDLVRHPGAAAIVPFVSDEQVLLIRQYRFATGGEILEVPAGKIDDNEPPESCARRELEEEAGRRAGRLEALGAIWTSPGFTDERIHLFSAFDLSEVPQRLQADEVIETLCLPLDDALARVWSGEISDAKSALALILAAQRLGRLSR